MLRCYLSVLARAAVSARSVPSRPVHICFRVVVMGFLNKIDGDRVEEVGKISRNCQGKNIVQGKLLIVNFTLRATLMFGSLQW